jgi:hypothetical protein
MGRRKLLKPVLLLVAVIGVIATGAFYYFKHAEAYTSNNGVVMYGDGTTSTTRGRTNARNYTYGNPGTVSGERVATQRANSNIQYVVEKSAPIRQERLDGQQKASGRLDIETCPGTCNTAGTFVAQWNTTAIASNTVSRVFDIAYEQLSGRGMVVYGGNVTGKVYYCIWDGTSWAPVSDCAPTDGVNDIDLTDGTTTLNGSPRWVKLAANGDQFSDSRTNQILLAVQDSNSDLYVNRWNGSSWSTTDRSVPTTTGGNSNIRASFDIAWENNSGTAMVVYANGTALTYRTSSGSGWSSGTSIGTLTSSISWVRMASDSKSDRLSMIVGFNTSLTVRGYIWKTNGTTAGWTAWSTDISAETNAGVNQNLDTAWIKANSGTSKAIFVTAASNALVSTYRTWTQAGGFTSAATTTGNNTDDADNVQLFASPNSDDVMMVRSDIDCDLKMQAYSGTAWKTIVSTTITSSLSSNTGTTSCASNTNHGQQPFAYAHDPYSTWSMNWRVYDDENTGGPPGVALAPEGVTPQVTPNNIVRLRINYAELGGSSQTDTRKKLQYSSGAGCPDSPSCTWTDVGAQASGSIWRYANGGATDNDPIASTVLTSSDTAGYIVENGTASATGASQPSGSIQEYDYTIQNNGATIGTVYYFRGYDLGASISGGSLTDLNAIMREQILDVGGTEATNCTTNNNPSVCTYPSMQAFTSAPQPPIIYQPLNGDTETPIAPIIQIRTSDQQADNVKYVIEWCPSNNWPCPSGGGSFDQTSSQIGWSGQDGDSGTTYLTSGVSEATSTMGEYTVSPGTFAPNTTYYLRAKAIDPSGSNTYSSYSSIYSFTTSTTDVLIQGGTTINGGTIIQ